MLIGLADLLHELFKEPKRQKRQHYSHIDPKISDLVKAFNQIEGITTIASCQGHIAGHIEAPYIYFKASNHVASQIVQALRKTRNFHTRWEITGAFDQNNDLTFRLSSLKLDTRIYQRGWWDLGWNRSKVDCDFILLRHMMKETFLDTH
ncbi:hypothetical protein [Vibrio scophthalmi]|uniref:Uncharacterized protein n=1 Tax=Vibrio scophthalmi LMG 19158 TaxID=870967 RepID=F9RIF5_9VIBR|nr:hypothetical protein [Vibrio scophthalmi]EGU42487.1 hypothetical protein VIS19158_11838 [Vibrio scophthalmi LMG 19158]